MDGRAKPDHGTSSLRAHLNDAGFTSNVQRSEKLAENLCTGYCAAYARSPFVPGPQVFPSKRITAAILIARMRA
jgi:hypothetical protein